MTNPYFPVLPRIHGFCLTAIVFVIGPGVASTCGQTGAGIPDSVTVRWRWESYWGHGFFGRFKGADYEVKVEFDSSDNLLGVCVPAQNDCVLYRRKGTELGPTIGRGPCVPDGDGGLCVSKFVEQHAPAKEKPNTVIRTVWVAKTSFKWLDEKYSPCSHASHGDGEGLMKWLVDKLDETDRHATTIVIPCFSKFDPEVYVLFERIRVADNRVMVIAPSGDAVWEVVAAFPAESPSYRLLRERIMKARGQTDRH